MRTLLSFILAVNLILLVYTTGENYIYSSYLIPRLMWSIDTLKINYEIMYGAAQACEKVPM